MLKKKKKLKCYDVAFDSDVYCISLVQDPAIEVNYVALSKEKPLQILLEKEDKHIIVGCALVPDKPIYRRDGDEEFYIQFSAETIEKLAHNYLANDRVYSFSTDHKDVADDVYIIETWLKTSENDKSKDYDLDVPIGSWLIMAKVENDAIWNRIKEGELQGFSIEAIVDLKEINNKIKNNMAKENKDTKLEAIEIDDSFWTKLKGILADALGKPEESKEVEETVGEIVDEMEKGAGPKDEETKVVEQAEDKIPAAVVNEEVMDVVESVNEVTATPAESVDALQAVIDGLQEEIAKKDEEIESLKKQNQKLSKQPSTKPVVKASAQKRDSRSIIEALYNGTYFNK